MDATPPVSAHPEIGPPGDPSHRDIERRNAALRTEIKLVRGGVGDAASLGRSLRDSVLYAPVWGSRGEADELQLILGEQAEIEWVEAFTNLTELARFVQRQGVPLDTEVGYITVRGHLLLEAIVERAGERGGLAIDVAGEDPMLIPAGALR